MLNLFNQRSSIQTGITMNPNWKHIRDNLSRNVTNAINFYKNNRGSVNASHLLIKLLTNLNVPFSFDPVRFCNAVDNMYLEVAMSLNMTSSIFKGGLFRETFYDKNISEILVVHNEGFDITKADRNWMALEPIRVIRHPRSDLSLAPLIPGVGNTEDGVAVITINPVMLALQYRAFRKANALYYVENESEMSLMQFLYMFPIANMLKSHYDVAVFNRFRNMVIDAPMGNTKTRPQFYVTDMTKPLRVFHEELIGFMSKNSRDMRALMRNIPVVTKENAEDLFQFPDVALTRQVYWTLIVASIPVIETLYEINKRLLSSLNKSEVISLRVTLERLKNDSIFKEVVPAPIRDTIFSEVQDILKYR